jgi:hypothetical protein
MTKEIGINGNYNTYLSPSQRTQVRVKDLQKVVDKTSQETGSSGKSDYYSDVKNARLYLSFEDDLSKVESSLQDLVFAKSRQDKMREVATRLKNIAGNFQVKLQEENTDKAVRDDSFRIFLRETQIRVTNLLNTEFNGEYLFSGQTSDVRPVRDLSTLGPMPAGATVDHSYYQGSDDHVVEYIDDDHKLPFASNAKHEGIEHFIRSIRLSLGADPSTPEGRARLSNAQHVCDEAFSKLADLEHFIGINIQEIEDKKDDFNLDQSRLSSNIKDMGFRDQLHAWMEYFSNKGQQDLVQTHWIETIKSTNELIKSL